MSGAAARTGEVKKYYGKTNEYLTRKIGCITRNLKQTRFRIRNY